MKAARRAFRPAEAPTCSVLCPVCEWSGRDYIGETRCQDCNSPLIGECWREKCVRSACFYIDNRWTCFLDLPKLVPGESSESFKIGYYDKIEVVEGIDYLESQNPQGVLTLVNGRCVSVPTKDVEIVSERRTRIPRDVMGQALWFDGAHLTRKHNAANGEVRWLQGFISAGCRAERVVVRTSPDSENDCWLIRQRAGKEVVPQ